MKLKKHYFILFLIFLLSFFAKANSINSAFKSLNEFDYFKAKQLFYKLNKKQINPFAAYGLSIIYLRNDNPFFNLDSASKYVNLSYCNFINKEKATNFLSFNVDNISILKMIDSIANKAFWGITKNNSLVLYNQFLKQNYLATAQLLKRAVYLRDELEFNIVLSNNSSQKTKNFINSYPQSEFIAEAFLLLERQIYNETTKNETPDEYILFLKNHPKNTMRKAAYEKLFKIYKNNSSIAGLTFFVNTYPKALQNIEAWQLLFSLSIKSFSNFELENFLATHPNCPLKNSLLNELELNKLQLFIYQKNDYYGCIDSASSIIIPNIYDAITSFNEGLSVVTKNDSVFYVNKKNENIFNQYYTDAYSFNNGIAAVKQNNNWLFINRQGQFISDIFEEVNELNNNCYVFKKNNKYGALDAFAQLLIEPKFEKLGDFKNEFAYYIENGKYGFISKNGYVHKAKYDWISDMGEDNIAIIKLNNKYGLINSKDSMILIPQFDQILKAKNSIYMLIKDNFYGFYSGISNCYLSQINYDYLKEKSIDFYTNGNILKLLKTVKLSGVEAKQQAFTDFNGKISIDFGIYDEINFVSNNLLKVKRKNKYGFVDKKLNVIIPNKFQQAQDFKDSLAIVKLKDKISLITILGKEIYTSDYELEKVSSHYYLVNSPEKMLINNKGEVIFTQIESIQKTEKKGLIITLINSNIKLIYD